MRPNERRQHILELLRQRERISVDELARTLGTSQETIRRDLAELADNGQVTKYHGGASLPPSGEHENAFQTRMNEFASEKRAVARYAAGLYAPGDSILIDTGTTTLFFARELARLSRITVITNSLQIATSIGASGNRVFMIGGEYRPESAQNTGALALEQIARFNAEHAVVTIGALNPDGAFDFSIEEAEITRAMIARTRYLTVIADSSKMGRRALFEVFPLSRIDRLITDRKPLGALAEALQAAHVEVHEAPALNRMESGPLGAGLKR